MSKPKRKVSGGIPEIGREPTPAENTLKLVRERPEVLDRMAYNTWRSYGDLTGVAARAIWDTEMSEHTKDVWRGRVMDDVERAVRVSLGEHLKLSDGQDG